ncbi:MAG: ExbD/TolR family protein [Pikeienuella sp.]
MEKISFGVPPARRKPSLTPMIDVVFLLLVFFMLASRFGQDYALPLPLAGSGEGWSGPPRLVDIAPETVALNGQNVAEPDLAAALALLMERPEDTIILRGQEGADLQRVIDVAEKLTEAGFGAFVLVE